MLWKTVRCLWTLDKSRVGRANATVPLLESGHPQRMSRAWAHAVGSPSGRKRPCRLTAKLWQTTLALWQTAEVGEAPHRRTTESLGIGTKNFLTPRSTRPLRPSDTCRL